MTDEVYLTKQEFLREFMYIDEQSVYRNVKLGMPCVEIDGVLRFPRYACHRWFAGCDDE